jgi:uncharacterized protein (UPF0332 family)
MLITNARRSLRSARLLLDSDDAAGAANRLYFVLFDAMRATISHRAGVDPSEVKTHHGVFRLFEQHIISAGLLAADEARIVYRAQELRWSGDYSVPIGVSLAELTRAFGPAEAFVDRCARIVGADEEGR